jgi:WD40 repeat protein
LLASLAPDGLLGFERLGAHMSDVQALAFTPDGTRLVTGSSAPPGGLPAEMICWALDVRSSPIWRVTYPASVTAIAISPDGRRVVVGGTDNLLRLFPIDQPSSVLSEFNVGAKIAASAFAHNRSLVAVTLFTDRVHVFEVSDNSLVPRSHFDQPGAAFSTVAFGSDDETLYVKGVGGVQRWDINAMRPLDPVFPLVDRLETFALISGPEAVIAITSKGKMILRSVPNPVAAHHAVVGPRPTPFVPK